MIRLVLCCAIVLVTAVATGAVERPAVSVGTEILVLEARLAEPSASDTLRYQVRAGRSLIVALPATFEEREASYRLLKAPALSWLVDRSFMWRTTAGERGQLAVLIERRAPGILPDTLVLLVDIVE